MHFCNFYFGITFGLMLSCMLLVHVKVALEQNKFMPPEGWNWNGDWFLNPELRLVILLCYWKQAHTAKCCHVLHLFSHVLDFGLWTRLEHCRG